MFVVLTVREAFLAEHVFSRFQAAVVDPMRDNARGVRAFEKCGVARTAYMVRERAT